MSAVPKFKVPPTRAQIEAELYASQFKVDMDAYRRMLAPEKSSYGGGMCRADGWDVSVEVMNGDFEVDEPLMRQLFRQTEGSLGKNSNSQGWLNDYLFGSKPKPEVMTTERFNAELVDAAIGPGNVLANANSTVGVINGGMQEAAVKTAIKNINSGASQSIKLNQYMTLYNANKSGKGRPRPRMRIVGLPVKVVKPSLGSNFRTTAKGFNGAIKSSDIAQIRAAGKLAASKHWTGYFSGSLTYGPSAVLDIHASIETDTNGNVHFDRRGFLVRSARSQSGNVIGDAASRAAPAIVGVVALVVFGISVGTVPLLIIGFGAGVLAQAAWGTWGGPDKAEKFADSMLPR